MHYIIRKFQHSTLEEFVYQWGRYLFKKFLSFVRFYIYEPM